MSDREFVVGRSTPCKRCGIKHPPGPCENFTPRHQLPVLWIPSDSCVCPFTMCAETHDGNPPDPCSLGCRPVAKTSTPVTNQPKGTRETVVELVLSEACHTNRILDKMPVTAALVDLLFADDPEPTPEYCPLTLVTNPAHTAWRHRADLKAAVLAAVGE